jgi:hypothetical protein
MTIQLCLLIAWVTLCVLQVGLVLISLLILEHFSNTSQVTIDHEGISETAAQTAKLDCAMDEPVQKARELADAFDEFAQLEDIVTLAPCDAIATVHSAVVPRAQHTGAVIIRDPRLTRARTLGDQSGIALNATFVFPTASGGRDTAA